MRSAPQRGLRPAISRMSAARVVGGRPDRRERRRQNARNPARCQRRMVAGWMSRVGSRQAGATRAARTIVKRCQGVYRTRPASFRLATMSCCRRSAFSATSSTRGERDPRPVRKRIEEGRSRVEFYTVRAVGICSQDALFNEIDPSPFREKDLDAKAEEFIVGWARDLPRDARLALVVYVDRPAGTADALATLRQAVREFFGHRAEASRRRMRQLFR